MVHSSAASSVVTAVVLLASLSTATPIPASPLCDPSHQRHVNLTLYMLHPNATSAWRNHNMGDLLGDALFVCADNYSVHHYSDAFFTEIVVEVDTAWGGYASCTDTDPGVCTPGAKLPGSIERISNNVSVGRHVATFWGGTCGGVINATGQCTPNTQTGSWYSLPSDGQCDRHLSAVHSNCTWRIISVRKTVRTTCLLSNGLTASCENPTPVEPSGCSYGQTAEVMRRALSFTDPTQGGCAAVPTSRVNALLRARGMKLAPSGLDDKAPLVSKPVPNSTTDSVFAAGEGGYAAFRIPGIATLRSRTEPMKHTVLAFAEGRKYGCGDFDGQHDVVMKRREYTYTPSTATGSETESVLTLRASSDWSDLTILLDPMKLFDEMQCPRLLANTSAMSCEFWDPTPVVDEVNGVIFLITTRSWNHSGVSNQVSRMRGLMDVWIINSSNAGSTWSKPRNITAMVRSKTWNVGTPANGHGIQLTQGIHAGRLLMPVYVRNGTDVSSRSAVFISDDYGVTWGFLETSTVGPGTSESDVVELQRAPLNPHGGGARLMFNHRPPRGEHVRYVSYSEDDGATFVNFTKAAAELIDPGCKGGIAAWRGEKALLFVNDDSTTSRIDVTLRLSTDDGATWPKKQLISEQGGYADVVVMERKLNGRGVEGTAAAMAVVAYERDTCSIDVTMIDPKLLSASGRRR